MKIIKVSKRIFDLLQECNPDEDKFMNLFWTYNLNGGEALIGELDHIVWSKKQIQVLDRGCNNRCKDYIIRIQK